MNSDCNHEYNKINLMEKCIKCGEHIKSRYIHLDGTVVSESSGEYDIFKHLKVVGCKISDGKSKLNNPSFSRKEIKLIKKQPKEQ